MGRYKTGAKTTSSVIRLELSYLIKNRYIQRGEKIARILSWTNGDSIGIESVYNEKESYIRLTYINSLQNGTTTEHDYKIPVTTIPSNLGIGEVLYFVCPVTGNKCRILYKCYGSLTFKSRTAYSKRIYYDCQICSKLYYHTERYFTLESRLNKLKKPIKTHYRGLATKSSIQYQRISGLKLKHDIERWKIFDLVVEKYRNKLQTLP